MRLLHATEHRFEEFCDDQVPKYVMLSHRWEDSEVSYQDFQDGKKAGGAGYSKIMSCCALSASRGHKWVWIDTCCIDKKSSAELSEAINSMYHWYQAAEECYAYLSDLSWDEKESTVSLREALQTSRWFTRGWTLQELLAPKEVFFFNSSWQPIGTKKSLSHHISEITGINLEYLTSTDLACIATKMSWLSKRQTSRREDMAYCMLGIFDINMPLLYGEGNKAFTRLQEEIIRTSSDESIFAWTADDASKTSGMLAVSPRDFADSGSVRLRRAVLRPPYWMTNRGLRLQVLSSALQVSCSASAVTAGQVNRLVLNCYAGGAGRGNLAIMLIKLPVHDGWCRSSQKLEDEHFTGEPMESATDTTIYVTTPVLAARYHNLHRLPAEALDVMLSP